MKDFGPKLQPVINKLVSSVSHWARFITFGDEGVLIAEEDPLYTYRVDDAAMAYHLFGANGLPEGFHFLPIKWIKTLDVDEDMNRAVQMRTFGEEKYD